MMVHQQRVVGPHRSAKWTLRLARSYSFGWNVGCTLLQAMALSVGRSCRQLVMVLLLKPFWRQLVLDHFLMASITLPVAKRFMRREVPNEMHQSSQLDARPDDVDV